MFEALQDGLSSALKTLRGQGKLTESNMRDGLKLVEQSLLEADVSFPVVRDFMQRVSEQAVGEKVLKSLNPSQQVVGIVYQELVNLMGPVDHSLHLKGADDVTVLMMCGLQGSGKTTIDRQAWPDAQSSAAAGRCSSPPTCSARPPSTSCTCSASSLTSRSTPIARKKIRSPSARRPCAKPRSTAPTS